MVPVALHREYALAGPRRLHDDAPLELPMSSGAAARDAQVIQVAREAIRALVAARPAGAAVGALLAPKYGRTKWAKRLWRRLAARGLVRLFEGPRTGLHGPATVAWIAALPGLEEAVPSDTALAHLLWAAEHEHGPALASESPDPEDYSGPDSSGPEELPDPEDSSGPGDLPDPEHSSGPARHADEEEGPTERELLAGLLRLCDTLAQAVIGLREDVQKLVVKVNDLERAWR
jgi:hypothetical protein